MLLFEFYWSNAAAIMFRSVTETYGFIAING